MVPNLTALPLTSGATRAPTLRGLWRRLKENEDAREFEGVVTFDSAHVYALFLAVLWLPVATLHSALVYWNGDTAYYLTATDAGREPPTAYQAFTPMGSSFLGVSVSEPFAAVSDGSYFTAGVGVLILPLVSGDFQPVAVVALGGLLAFVAAASGAFHAGGSQGGSWAHALDRLSMYSLFVYATCTSVNAAWHSVRGVQQSPRSAVAATTNVLGASLALYFVITQQEIESTTFLVGTGFAVFLLLTISRAGLLFHQFALDPRCSDESSTRRALAAFLLSLPDLATQMVTLGVGFLLNISSAGHLDCALVQEGCAGSTNEERVEQRKLHSLTHGVWHFQTALVLCVVAVSTSRGLAGVAYARSANPKTCPRSFFGLLAARAWALTSNDAYEYFAMAVTVAVSLAFFLLDFFSASSDVWLEALLAISSTVAPLAAFLFWRARSAHVDRMDQYGGNAREMP